MFGHVTVGTNDLERAIRFYDAVLATLGQERSLSGETFAAYGDRSGARFFVMKPFDGAPASVGNGVHVAFAAPTPAHVDAFYAEALAQGGTDEGPPGPRPHYHPGYYGGYVRDPDGNKLQAVCHQAG